MADEKKLGDRTAVGRNARAEGGSEIDASEKGFEWQRLIFKMNSTNADERFEAAIALSAAAEPRSSFFLAQALYDPSERIRKAAANGLAAIGTEYAIAAIIRVMALKDFQVEDEAIYAVQRMADVKTVRKLDQLLGNTLLLPAAAFALQVITRSLLEQKEANTELAAELLAVEKALRSRMRSGNAKTQNLVGHTLKAIDELKAERQREARELKGKVLQFQRTVQPRQQRSGVVVDLQEYRSRLQRQTTQTPQGPTPPKTTLK